MEEEDELLQKQRGKAYNSVGPYVLRPLVDDIPLTTVEETGAVRITCVELWGMSTWGKITDYDEDPAC